MPACGRLIYPYWKLNSNATYKGVIKKKAKSFPILLLLTQFFRSAKVSYEFLSVTSHISVSLTLLILELRIIWALDSVSLLFQMSTLQCTINSFV